MGKGGRTLRQSFRSKPVVCESGDGAVEELDPKLVEHDTAHIDPTTAPESDDVEPERIGVLSQCAHIAFFCIGIA